MKAKPWKQTWVAKWSEHSGYDCMTSGTEIRCDRSGREVVTVDHGRGPPGLDRGGGDWRNPDRDADAHLIAAAPELYRSVEDLLAILDVDGPIVDRARTALKKARGET